MMNTRPDEIGERGSRIADRVGEDAGARRGVLLQHHLSNVFGGLRVGFEVSGFEVWGFGFRVWGLGFGVWGFGCRV